MGSNTIHLMRLESESVHRDTIRAFEAAELAAENLQHATEAAFDAATSDPLPTADADALAARAEHLRGAALHVIGVAADLARCSGRIEQLAALRRAEITD